MATYQSFQQSMTKPICPSINKTQVCKHVFDRVQCLFHNKGTCKYIHDPSDLKTLIHCRFRCKRASCHFFHTDWETKESYLKRVNLKDTSKEYNPPRHLPCKKISFCFEKDVLKPIIGVDGCKFKYITEKSGVSYIWYNDDTKCVEIWGYRNKIPIAEQLLFKHSLYIIGQIIKKNPSQIKNKKTFEWYNRCQPMMIH